MNSNLYPKFNILLLEGNTFLEEVFLCFLDRIYQSNLYTKTDAGVCIKTDRQNLKIINDCLDTQFDITTNRINDYIKTQNIFCKIVFCYKFSNLQQTQEIFSYINHKKILDIIKKFAKKNIKQQIKTLFFSETENVSFKKPFFVKTNIPSKEQEIINNIICNLS